MTKTRKMKLKNKLIHFHLIFKRHFLIKNKIKKEMYPSKELYPLGDLKRSFVKDSDAQFPIKSRTKNNLSMANKILPIIDNLIILINYELCQFNHSK